MWRDRTEATEAGDKDCASHETNNIQSRSEAGRGDEFAHNEGYRLQNCQNFRWPVAYVHLELTAIPWGQQLSTVRF